MNWASFLQQILLVALGAGGTLVGVWLNARSEAKRADQQWRRERSDAEQAEFERRLIEVLVRFGPWSHAAETTVQAILDPSKRGDGLPDYEKHRAADSEIARMLVELEVASRDEETLDLVQDAQRARQASADLADAVATGGDDDVQRLLLGLQEYRGAIDDLRMLNVRRKMPERLI